jgi:hypothetical protein
VSTGTRDRRGSVREMEDIAADLADVLEDTAELAFRLVSSVTRLPALAIGGLPRPSLPAARCGCDIPPPCWMPVSLGELKDHVCPGETASVRIRVTNCGGASSQVRLEAAGAASPVTISGSPLSLGPMERGVLSASFALPPDADEGDHFEILLWVRGCRTHFLRWMVKVDDRGAGCCHEVDVEDCPDLVHHWYDHFYCAHPCQGH